MGDLLTLPLPDDLHTVEEVRVYLKLKDAETVSPLRYSMDSGEKLFTVGDVRTYLRCLRAETAAPSDAITLGKAPFMTVDEAAFKLLLTVYEMRDLIERGAFPGEPRGGRAHAPSALVRGLWDRLLRGADLCALDGPTPALLDAVARWRACELLCGATAVPVPAACRVYFIQAGDAGGPVKIGFARDPMKRLADLQVGNALPLALRATFPGAARGESHLHACFHADHLRGEWFRMSPFLRVVMEEAAGRDWAGDDHG